MASIRITADLPAGDVEINRTFWETSYVDNGTKALAAALADAANAVLRSYGVKEELAVVSEAAAALNRLRKSNDDTYPGREVGD